MDDVVFADVDLARAEAVDPVGADAPAFFLFEADDRNSTLDVFDPVRAYRGVSDHVSAVLHGLRLDAGRSVRSGPVH
jgi:hypothetical protein